MNAKEAREKAYTKNVDLISGQYGKIKKEIYLAVEQGKYGIWIYHDILQDVKDKLRDEGFSVGNAVSHMNEVEIQIKW